MSNLRTKWYRKPSNKNILVHCFSAHPTRTKKAIIGKMFKTAAGVCSGSEEKQESLDLATTIAISNGYSPGETRSWQRSNQMRKGHTSIQNKIQFCMPFISDDVSRATRLCLRRAELEDLVTIVEIPPMNLKHQLVRNRIYHRLCTTPDCMICPFGREGDCIYMIKCTVNPRRRGRHSGRGSGGSHVCQHSTSSSLICVSRFTVIFTISANDLAVTWATWKLTASAPPLDP
ncbi:hypothetical protein Y032_0073g743 [Ancylostoma ceylanicum]|uniref:Helix-turn-helix domain-containing protein n=1 Tax=Ancylostoma ceylanicum TaxID=53326 RepID=A0A016TUZ3_9BILA|nr:hypothetical protein Y032_0073g743 [Ancylostoma ceylanicum]